ncbi:MAG: hypothetical protein QM757_09505 [Paludibaculum sp.]
MQRVLGGCLLAAVAAAVVMHAAPAPLGLGQVVSLVGPPGSGRACRRGI